MTNYLLESKVIAGFPACLCVARRQDRAGAIKAGPFKGIATSFFWKVRMGKTKNNLKKIREDMLLTKSELARKAGISPITIDRIEKGYICRVDTKRKIIQALGLKLSEKEVVFSEG